MTKYATDGDLDPKALMRKRYKIAANLVESKYQLCIDDIRFTFVPGAQKDLAINPRALYEFNKTRPVVKSVTNDMRQNDPAIKVRAEQDANKDTAELFNGLIKNIEAHSRANTAYDTGGFFAAAGGFGVIEVATEYSNDDAFEQDIKIREKRDPFCVKFGPAKEFDKRDQRYLFEDMYYTKEEFEQLWPNADKIDFDVGGSSVRPYEDWFAEKRIRVVKYWCKHREKKTIYQLSDGRVLDQDDYDAILPTLGQQQPDSGVMMQPPLELKKQRDVWYDKITVEICSGAETLEGPTDWPGKFIPYVPVWGESVNVEGEEYFSGIARPIKDSQRVFNWAVCAGLETMSQQPRSPVKATPAMIAGHEQQYQNLNKDNDPVLLYNIDPANPGATPTREQPPAFPAAFFNGAQFSADLIKSVSNVVDAPIQSRASSGKAIQAVEHQQDVGNFDYIDNLARAKAFVGEILVDLIPKIYDTEREVMILGEDGKESYATLNQTVIGPDGQPQVINDLSQGKYAVTVTVGPSYATQRMETVAALTQIASNPNPQISALASYGIVKNMDEPGMQDVEKALRKMLIMQGLIEPGEGDQPPPQQQPDPTQQAEAMYKQAQAMLAQANAALAEAKTAQTKVDTAITVQHAPMLALQEAAKTDMHMTEGYTKSPETPYFGPPQPNGGQPPQQ